MTRILSEGESSTARQDLSGVSVARIATVPFFVKTQLAGQIRDLISSGAEVHIVTTTGPESPDIRAWPGVHYQEIRIDRSISPFQDMMTIMHLYCFFRHQRIQITHSTTPKAGLLTAIAAVLARVPIRLHTFTGQPWISLRGAKRKIAMASDQLIGLLSTYCFADSESQSRFLIEHRIVAPRKISVIGAGSLAGVDLTRFDRDRFPSHQQAETKRSMNIPEDATVILFVGRITPDKGVRELLSAFRGMDNGARAHLVLVGERDTGSGVSSGHINPEELQDEANIHFVGYVPDPELYLAIADVLCLPSYREGFGTVIIEAAAMGVPAIGTDIYGLSDAIVDGETGLLVPVRDIEALRHALNTMCNDARLRDTMGQAARSRALQLFDAKVCSAALITEYRKLIAENVR